MIQVILNGAFGAGLLMFAFQAVRKGWPFLRHGWTTIQTQTAYPDFRQNVERRRAVSDGGRFLIGGLLWLGASLFGLAAGLYFTGQAILWMNTPP